MGELADAIAKFLSDEWRLSKEGQEFYKRIELGQYKKPIREISFVNEPALKIEIDRRKLLHDVLFKSSDINCDDEPWWAGKPHKLSPKGRVSSILTVATKMLGSVVQWLRCLTVYQEMRVRFSPESRSTMRV